MHLSSVNIGISHFLLHLVARVLLLIDLKLKCCFTALCCVISCDCNASFSFSSTEKCDEALVTPLPHNAFTSSSVFTSGYAPGYAKLNKRGGTVKHFHNTCSHIHAHQCELQNEQTLFSPSQHNTSINTLELWFYDSNILHTSISQVLRLDIVLCHFNKHSCTIWHCRVITSITPGVNYWIAMAHPIMPNCAFEKHYVLRTN